MSEQSTVTITVRHPGGVRPAPAVRLGPGAHEVRGDVYDAFRESSAWKAFCKCGHVSVRDERAAAPEPAAPSADGELAAEDKPKGKGRKAKAEAQEPAAPSANGEPQA